MKRKAVAAFWAVLALILFAACEEGPAEKAGKKLDKLGRDTKEKAGDLLDSAREKLGR